MKTLLIQLSWLLTLSTGLLAQQASISGSWKGALEVPGDKFTLVVHISNVKMAAIRPHSTALTKWLISPEQNHFRWQNTHPELPPMAVVP